MLITLPEINCRFCGEPAMSGCHITPDCVEIWLKKQLGPVKLVRRGQSLKEEQSTDLFNLLCKTCDNKLGTFDKKFMEGAFRPFFDFDQRQITYDRWLHDFIVQLLWKATRVGLEQVEGSDPIVTRIRDFEAALIDSVLSKEILGPKYEIRIAVFDFDVIDDFVSRHKGLISFGFYSYLLQGLAHEVMPHDWEDDFVVRCRLPGIFVWGGERDSKMLDGVKVVERDILSVGDGVNDSLLHKLRLEVLPDSLISHVHTSSERKHKLQEKVAEAMSTVPHLKEGRGRKIGLRDEQLFNDLIPPVKAIAVAFATDIGSEIKEKRTAEAQKKEQENRRRDSGASK